MKRTKKTRNKKYAYRYRRDRTVVRNFRQSRRNSPSRFIYWSFSRRVMFLTAMKRQLYIANSRFAETLKLVALGLREVRAHDS